MSDQERSAPTRRSSQVLDEVRETAGEVSERERRLILLALAFDALGRAAALHEMANGEGAESRQIMAEIGAG